MENWDDYRFFLAVADAGSVSAAAKILSMTQPTVGRRVSEFERRLGTTLFLRSPTGYRLTEMGTRLRDRVRVIQAESRWIEDRFHFAENSQSGRVTLTTAVTLSAYGVTPLIDEFHRTYPDIELDVMVTNEAMDLLSGTADVAFRVGDPGTGEYVGKQIGQTHFGLFAGHTYLQRAGEPATLDELPNHQIIESARHLKDLPQCALLRRYAKNARSILRADCIDLQIQAAGDGLGIVALPLHCASNNPQLKRILAGEFHLSRDLWLLTHRDLKSSPRVRAVIDFIENKVAAHLRGLEGLVNE